MVCKPLDGVDVLEFPDGYWCGAGLAGSLAASLGARVTVPEDADWGRDTIELLGATQDDVDAMAAQWWRGKHIGRPSLTSKTVTDVLSLVTGYDVLIGSRSWLGFLAEHDLTPEAVQMSCPHLVQLIVTPHGSDAPHDDPASELTLQAETGILSVTGQSGDEPTRAGIPLAASSAALLGTAGAVAALLERRRSGEGQIVECAERDALLAFVGSTAPSHFLLGRAPSRIGNRHVMAAPWNTYECADGWVVIATMGDRQWRELCLLMGQSDLAADEGFRGSEERVRNVDAVDRVVTDWTCQRSVESVIEELERVGVPVGPIAPPTPLTDDGDAADSATSKSSPCPFNLKSVERTGSCTDGEASLVAECDRHSAATAPLRPLAGQLIVEAGAYTAGPVAGRLLAALGARVVKLEPPDGEPTRRVALRINGDAYLYLLNNTDKQSLASSSDDEHDRALLRQLLGTADAVLTNLSSEQNARLALSQEDINQVSPRAVYCKISGYGDMAGAAQKKAFDTVVQATSGIMEVTGWPNGMPTRLGISVADQLGASAAALAIVSALYARESQPSTWNGLSAEISLQRVSQWATVEAWPRLGQPRRSSRNGNAHPWLRVDDVYHTADGILALGTRRRSDVLSVLRLAKSIVETEPAPALTSGPGAQGIGRVRATLTSWLMRLSTDDALRLCRQAGVPASRVLGLDEALDFAEARGRMVLWQETAQHGRYRVLGMPIRMSRSQTDIRTPAPSIGEHTDAISNELAALRDAAAVRSVP